MAAIVFLLIFTGSVNWIPGYTEVMNTPPRLGQRSGTGIFLILAYLNLEWEYIAISISVKLNKTVSSEKLIK